MQIAASYPDDVFSQTFLKHADKMLARGKEALQALDDSEYETWTKETLEHGGFCFQDFTLARLTEIEGSLFKGASLDYLRFAVKRPSYSAE